MGAYERIARVIQRAGRRMGLAVTRYPPPGSLARHLRTLFQRLDINCVLDVGAHTGGYARTLRNEVGFHGQIVSFEPASESFRLLNRAFRGDAGWRGYRYALGRRPGSADLHVFAGTDLNSFLSPSSYGAAWNPKSLKKTAVESVEIQPLARVFDEVTRHVQDPRVHLKVDAQGFDLDVIEGAAPILDRVLSMQTEVSLRPIYDHQPGMDETLPRLRELGFEITGMFPVARDRDGLRLIEIDCVLLRG
jgi:FkbM family methyltransferase